jgi:hypothetical protein
MKSKVPNEKHRVMTVRRECSPDCFPRPQIEVPWPQAASGGRGRGNDHRQLNALLLLLAARVEQATPASERWVVSIKTRHDELGIVYLELSEGSDGEAQRGLAILQKVVGDWR